MNNFNYWEIKRSKFATLSKVIKQETWSGSRMTNKKIKVLFLCTGNSCRSQMAEGWTRQLKSNLIDVYSAGIESHRLDPRAVAVMKEAGVDIGYQRSKKTTDLTEMEFDYVITVCSDADRNCPFFPAKTKIIHHSFDDPSRLAQHAGTEEEVLSYYRRVRDEIKAFVERLPDVLLTG